MCVKSPKENFDATDLILISGEAAIYYICLYEETLATFVKSHLPGEDVESVIIKHLVAKSNTELTNISVII